MCFVADAPRFANGEQAFIDATTNPAARVVVDVGVLSRTRYGDMSRH
jgi:hypothetical protein